MVSEEKIVEVENNNPTDVIEERYVLCKTWKRLVAFLIDFLLFMGIIFVFNNYVTKGLYKLVYDIDEVKETYENDIVELGKAYGAYDSDGNALEPVISGYVCVVPYGTYSVGDVIDYTAYENVREENLDKWTVDPIYKAIADLYTSDEYKTLVEDYEKIESRYKNITWITDSILSLVLVYLLPTWFFKNGRTLGKKLMKILIVDSYGNPVSALRYTYRTVLGFWTIEFVTSVFLMYIPLLISGLYTFINRYHKAFHDIFFGTYIVDEVKQERLIHFEPEVVTESSVEKTVDGEDYY